MMKFLSVVLFVLGASGLNIKENINFVPFKTQDGRSVQQILEVNNPYGVTGDWGAIDVCPNGSYVGAANAKFLAPDNLDEKAVTGLKFYCQNKLHMLVGEVNSKVGFGGQYCGMRACSDGFVSGVRVKTLEYQGKFTDDVAVQDIKLSCNYGEETIPLIYDGLEAVPEDETVMIPPKSKAFNDGEWSYWLECSHGLFVCGLETLFEETSVGDDVAVVNIRLYCCLME